MNYQEALSYIHSLDKFGSRPGLDRVQKLFDRFPGVLDQRFIHIAGTNGKGSVAMMLSYILRQAGYRVGLFISPYIVSFRERIQVDNRMITEDELAGAVTLFAPVVDELSAQGVVITEFELLTVLAFYLYKQRGCDLVVCEVGMGGLLDSTNLIRDPLCAVITRVDLDHTAILGDTIGEIARQKAGIIKPGCTTAVAAQRAETYAVIEAAAREQRSALYRAEDIALTVTDMSMDGTSFVYRDTPMRLPLIGAHQVDNLRCALAAVEALNTQHKLHITTDDIRSGLAQVRHPARFEKLRDHPAVILDGAHNPNGLSAFADAVRAYAPDGDRTLIIGMLADKDSRGLSQLRGLFSRIIATDVDNPRALDAAVLADRLSDICDSVEVIRSPRAALERALSYGEPVFICGSLYLASTLRPMLLPK